MKRLIAYFLLFIIICSCTSDAELTKMRLGLESINIRNRKDQPFSVSEVEQYVRFFDNYGTSNDRLKAYYLLGRAYYEKGEVPMALQCYYDAINYCDTTAQDCDFAQLSRVYGQMARIFYDQDLFIEQIMFEKSAVKYAWTAKDTLAALMSYEQLGHAYNNIGKQDSAIMVIEDVASQYKQYGYPKYSAIALGTIVYPLVVVKDYAKARQYIDIYENISGFFDNRGNIMKGREIYYRVKGYYYLAIDSLDSAEFYFRKELLYGKDFNNQHSAALGLKELYQRKQQNDSIAKYAVYAYDMGDSMYTKKATKEVKRIQAMFDYTRQREIARKETEKAVIANRRQLLISIVLLITMLIATWLYIARKKVMNNLRSISYDLTNAREELLELQKSESINHESIIEKEKRILQLERKLGKYSKMVYFGTAKAENDLLLSPNYRKIKDIAYKGQILQENDWEIACQLITEYFPGYNEFLNSRLKKYSTDYQVCLLLRLHFKAGEIANMLNVTPPYISKVSSAVLINLFRKKGSSKELSKELSKIF